MAKSNLASSSVNHPQSVIASSKSTNNFEESSYFSADNFEKLHYNNYKASCSEVNNLFVIDNHSSNIQGKEFYESSKYNIITDIDSENKINTEDIPMTNDVLSPFALQVILDNSAPKCKSNIANSGSVTYGNCEKNPVDYSYKTYSKSSSLTKNWEELLNCNFEYQNYVKDFALYEKRKNIASKLLNEQASEHERKKSLQTNFWIEEDEPLHDPIASSSNERKECDYVPWKNNNLKTPSSKNYMCHICGVMLKGRSSLRTHIFRHLQIKSYQCKFCSKSFTQSSILKNHIRTHTGERPYSCCECNSSFKTKSVLLKHLTKHSFHLPFKCNLCWKAFKNKPALNLHLKIHNKGPITCLLCDSTFESSTALSNHKLKEHTQRKIFKCTECEREYSEKRYLKQHMILHSGERKYCCRICKSTFLWKSGLATHMVTHSFKIQCELCDKKFTSLKKLKKHRNRHENPKPYACSKCDIKFKYAYLLKRHNDRHKKDIVCNICNLSFTKKNLYKKHLSTHAAPSEELP